MDQSLNADRVYKSACRMCHGGCGVLVHVADNTIVKIEGDPDNPMNKGKLCPMGAASLEHVYNPRRLKYPMRRVGPRGSGRWERISWDTAYGEIVDRIRATTDRGSSPRPSNSR